MKIKNILLGGILLFVLVSAYTQTNGPTKWVDPFIGTGGHGHTYPGAVYPFGMVQLSPDTRLTGWDGCSAYHHSDSIVYGFSHTHLSGTGVSDYGDVLLMPYTGDADRYEENKIASSFSHKDEDASPGYYKVSLSNYDVDAELTVTERCGFHKYTFQNPQNNEGLVLVDLIHRDHVTDSYLKVVNEYEIEGYRHSRAWATDQRLFFVIKFNLPFELVREEMGAKVEWNKEDNSFRGDSIRTSLKFDIKQKDFIYAKIAISGVDLEGARKNLRQEIPNWDFKGVKEAAQTNWNKQLNKIQVFGGSIEEKKIFYTALYHNMIVPNVFSDVDGRYRGMDAKIHKSETGKRYTVFSLWDTFRGTHPLYTLIEQKRTSEFINTFIGHHEQTGLLPVWELAGNETNCMIGSHGVSVVADAIKKDIGGFDIEKAYLAMKSSLDQDVHELNMYREFGYMPSDEVMESVSKTLEFAYDDWCLASTANLLGYKKDYKKYIRRAQFYKNIYDPSTGFMRPKLNGAWRSPFDPREVDFNFTEANSWQYSFFVPQDINGLIDFAGGEQSFELHLDKLFTADSKTTGRHQSDITGLIGQYAHGNEPSHHMALLYNFIGKPWKTQKYIREIREKMYSAKPDGYSGNEDCGQMSAWYVLNALGFYPVTPGNSDYVIGLPLFPRMIINLENGKHFIIENIQTGKTAHYIKSIEMNGKPYTKSYLRHEDIVNGGKLVFVTGDSPGDNWGISPEDLPVTFIDEHLLVVSPTIKDGKQSFHNEYLIELDHPDRNAEIYYRIRMANDEFGKWLKYKEALIVRESGEIEFYAKVKKNGKSQIEKSKFLLMANDWKIELENKYGSQYTGGGKLGLIDQIRGKENFADGSWQGYQGKDLIATIDLSEKKQINRIGAGFLQSQRSWIFFPEKLEIFTSEKGKKFKKLGEILNGRSHKENGTILQELILDNVEIETRYIKLIAKNMGHCPDWHPGAGSKSWIFVDEIIIE